MVEPKRSAGAYRLARPVYLIGFMGAGKTSVAQYLAVTCGLATIDADEYLELQEDRVISDIFAEDGEGAFRDLETKYLKFLSTRSPRLIACGGGVVLREENRAILRDTGFVVYLHVSADEAAARIPNTSSRPLFKNIETARASVAAREQFYEAAADVRVETDGRSVPQIAEQIRDILLKQGVLMENAEQGVE